MLRNDGSLLLRPFWTIALDKRFRQPSDAIWLGNRKLTRDVWRLCLHSMRQRRSIVPRRDRQDEWQCGLEGCPRGKVQLVNSLYLAKQASHRACRWGWRQDALVRSQ